MPRTVGLAVCALVRRTPSGGSETGHGQIVQAELLKLKKSGQIPDESVKIKGAPIHYG
jgi:hypothetical protein